MVRFIIKSQVTHNVPDSDSKSRQQGCVNKRIRKRNNKIVVEEKEQDYEMQHTNKNPRKHINQRTFAIRNDWVKHFYLS
jgi:hypothetical protein